MHILARTVAKGYDLRNNVSMFFGYLDGLGILTKYREYRLHLAKVKKLTDRDVIKNFKYKSNAQKLLYKFLIG
jgi:hypothetical protein